MNRLLDFICPAGILNPIVLLVPMVMVGVLWEMRWISNRVFVGVIYVASVAYAVHVDLVVARVLGSWSGFPIRVIGYLVGAAVITWGGWGYTKMLSGPEKIALPRGAAYWRDRRNRNQ